MVLVPVDDGPRKYDGCEENSAYLRAFHRATRARRERVDNRVYGGNFPPLTDTRDEISRENSIRYFSRAWSRCQAMWEQRETIKLLNNC